ncbi:MAG TPA: hypothetical protein VF612_11350 [Jatrophihabitans sp.]|uniref:hypothetical protein n=1 Tax=Jatrophihabitans sp. TaxID=1932789 RepID=UPI002F2166C4
MAVVGEQFKNATLEVKRAHIRRTAAQFGLAVTSETSGKHAAGSLHYKGRAIDVAGPASSMLKFFRAYEPLAARWMGVCELFYDPAGAYDNGHKIPAIGGHGNHVHIGFDPP